MKSVLIIAEAGVNHNGNIAVAKKLIDVAAEAGADYVKFQTFKASNLVSKSAQKAEYQKKNTQNEDTQYQMLKKLELSERDHVELMNYCKLKNINFLSTAFDIDSLDLLVKLGIDVFKIPSGEITNYQLIKKIGSFKSKIILSTGMSTLSEINEALEVLQKAGTKLENITVLHCNTEYPTPMVDVNLRAMLEIKNKLNVEVGYSDHTLGIEVPIAATALGATIIEKHFTLDKLMDGPDHAASLDPVELKNMIRAIRNIELAMGSNLKQPTESELKNLIVARKSIHVINDLEIGHVLKESDLIMKRPGNGISPMEVSKVIGRKIARNLKAETQLKYEDLE